MFINFLSVFLGTSHENAFREREIWEQQNRKENHHRHKRSISTDKIAETLVVVDPQMVKYYQNEDIENYVLTVMNMVSIDWSQQKYFAFYVQCHYSMSNTISTHICLSLRKLPLAHCVAVVFAL